MARFGERQSIGSHLLARALLDTLDHLYRGGSANLATQTGAAYRRQSIA